MPNIYELAIEKWGKNKQILMMLEEMSELAFLLFKKLRNNVVDNWQISEEIAEMKIKKLDRLRKKLEED